ncbi:MAG: hypothetical protein QOH39_3032 [Verrucomicrobiota bacterium]|jgi:hypothetical protein
MSTPSGDYTPRHNIIELPNGEFHGRRSMWLESFGALHTDIYGLSTASAVWVAPADAMQYPAMYTAHPIWSFLHMEKRTVMMEYGFCRTVCEYAGFEGVPVPVIEYSTGVSEEKIQTHPNFADFAGTASHPLNGAIFVDSDGKQSFDDSKGSFKEFIGTGAFGGVESYLNPCLTKRRTTISQGPVSQSGVGHIDGGMLKVLASSTQRGIVYQNVEEWRGGGRRGINASIYG